MSVVEIYGTEKEINEDEPKTGIRQLRRAASTHLGGFGRAKVRSNRKITGDVEGAMPLKT